MQRRLHVSTLLAGALGVVLIAVGVVYLTVACENLPAILGPHPGDTSPRTALGMVGVLLGLAALALAFISTRRRPPKTPLHS
jgi:hypothetical protein